VAGNWKRRGDARCIHRVVDIAGVMPKGGRTAGGQTYGAAEPQKGVLSTMAPLVSND
jgi:hypothetical protein